MDDLRPTEAQLAAFRDLYDDPQLVQVELNKMQAFQLLGALQLCTRHPHLPVATRELVTGIAISIQKAIAPSGELAAIAEKGWRPECDVKAEPDERD